MWILLRCMWRFERPLLDRSLRLVYAGPHFQASLGLTQERLAARRPRDDGRVTKTTPWIELCHAPTPESLWELAQTADVAVPFMERFDQSFLERASKLRLVMQFGVGLEGVDVSSAKDLGIAVSNIPATQSGNAQATAEHTLWLTLSLLRQTHTELVKRFQQRELGGVPLPRSLVQKNVTVVGYGAVGSQICQYFRAMGAARVTTVRRQDFPAHDPEISVTTNLADVLPDTDILVLACPLTESTKNLINQDTLRFIPPESIIVNVGRGALVCHTAILEALQKEALAGYASDVGVGHPTKPSEPWDPHDELSLHPCALFTPHVGGYTDYSYRIMTDFVLDAVENVREGRPPDVWVNQ